MPYRLIFIIYVIDYVDQLLQPYHYCILVWLHFQYHSEQTHQLLLFQDALPDTTTDSRVTPCVNQRTVVMHFA